MGPDPSSTDLAAAFRLDDKVAVVTGGGSGIGRAIARVLAGAGAAVMIGDVNDEWAEQSCQAIADAGGKAAYRHTDVGVADDVEGLAAAAEERFGALDVLCTLGGPPAPFVEVAAMTDEQFDAVVATHVKSVVYGCRAAAPRMARRGGGAIVTMASTVVDRPTARNGLYQLAKSAVVSLTRTMAIELAEHGIRVNALAPGATLTRFSGRYFTAPDGTVDEGRRAQWLAEMGKLSPLGITGEPEDQAWLALYLVSPASRFVTGQVIRANGGWSMA